MNNKPFRNFLILNFYNHTLHKINEFGVRINLNKGIYGTE